MNRQHIITLITPLFLFINLTSCSSSNKKSDYLLSFNDSIKNECGYKNKKEEIVIPQGKYSFCFTDTFRTFAIVLKNDIGFVAIDRQENILYKVFPYDNGPDYISDGLFRITENNKIGFADSLTGMVIIKPQFDCALPFENGVTKVSNNCKTEYVGEYGTWVSDNWYYIDKTGRKVEKPKNTKER